MTPFWWSTRAREAYLFGRNEGANQRFHRWLDALIETQGADLPGLVAHGIDSAG